MGEVEHGRVARPCGDFCERIGAGNEENLRTFELSRELASSVSNVYDGPCRSISMRDADQPECAAAARLRHVVTLFARRADGIVRCGGMWDGISVTASRPSACCAANAAATWPL